MIVISALLFFHFPVSTNLTLIWSLWTEFGQFGMHGGGRGSRGGRLWVASGSGDYRCCCFHARSCLLAVAALETLVAALQIYDGVPPSLSLPLQEREEVQTRRMLAAEFGAGGERVYKDSLGIGIELGSGVGLLTVAVLLAFALLRDLRALLLPHLVWTLIAVGLSIAYLVFLVLALFAGYPYWPRLRRLLVSSPPLPLGCPDHELALARTRRRRLLGRQRPGSCGG